MGSQRVKTVITQFLLQILGGFYGFLQHIRCPAKHKGSIKYERVTVNAMISIIFISLQPEPDTSSTRFPALQKGWDGPSLGFGSPRYEDFCAYRGRLGRRPQQSQPG